MRLISIYPERVQIKTDSVKFSKLKINDLLLISDENASIVCVINGITGTEAMEVVDYDAELISHVSGYNTLDCGIIGSIVNGKYTKAIDVYPSTDVEIRVIDDNLFCGMLAGSTNSAFKLGAFSNYNYGAFLDGNKFFARHSCIVGNSGSGKSFTVATMLEMLNCLAGANVILFDLHGEYSKMSFIKRINIGPEGFDFPVWFLPFRDIYSSLLKIKEETSTTQIAALRKAYYKARRSGINEGLPVSLSINEMIDLLVIENEELISTGEVYKTGDRAGLAKTVKGDNYGKLSSIIQLLKDKVSDGRYSFMFHENPQDYLNHFIAEIYGTDGGNIKAVDLSSVPHEMIPVVIAAITKLIYSIHLQQDKENIIPLCLFCEEAHVYIPSDNSSIGPSQRRILDVFETIAKEGRKFGATLCIVSQRPSELNRTIMSQCANYIVMKLSNDMDKAIIKSTLPESSRGLIDSLALFSPGDCLVIGDSVNITLKIKIDAPNEEPDSHTVNMWDAWSGHTQLNTDDLLHNMFEEWK